MCYAYNLSVYNVIVPSLTVLLLTGYSLLVALTGLPIGCSLQVAIVTPIYFA